MLLSYNGCFDSSHPFFNCCSSYFYFLFAYQMSWVSEIKDTEHIWASSCICRLSGNLCLCLPYSLFLTFQGKVIWWNFIKLGSMETKIMDSVLQVCRICEVGKEGKKNDFLRKNAKQFNKSISLLAYIFYLLLWTIRAYQRRYALIANASIDYLIFIIDFNSAKL